MSRSTCAACRARAFTAEGRTIHYVAKQLGHSVLMTMNTYGHVIDELEDDVGPEKEIQAGGICAVNVALGMGAVTVAVILKGDRPWCRPSPDYPILLCRGAS
jgi:hypothetical protein